MWSQLPLRPASCHGEKWIAFPYPPPCAASKKRINPSSLVRGQSHIWAANSACNGNPSKEVPLSAPSACGLGNQGWLEERGTSDWCAANQRETLPESERRSLCLSFRKSLLHVSVILMNKWRTVDEHMEDGAHFVNPSTIERSRDAGVVSLGDLSLAGEQSDHVTLEAICH